jgi:hypothetical protein
MFEVQKKQALNETNIQFEKAKSQFEMERIQTEAKLKIEMLEVEFAYDMQLEKQKSKANNAAMAEKEALIEDRKDQRSKQEATQQSQLINQSQNDLLPTDFNNQIQ